MNTGEMKWAWMDVNTEVPHGLFDTKEKAILDAIVETNGGIQVYVGTVTFVRAEEFTPELDEFVAFMGDVFIEITGLETKFDTKPGAAEAFDEAMAEWASNYVAMDMDWYLDPAFCEKVTISAGK